MSASTSYPYPCAMAAFPIACALLFAFGTAAHAQTETPPVVEEDGATTGPSAPDLTLTSGDRRAALSWTPPSDDGGSGIAKYQYRRKAGSGTFGAWTDIGDSSDSGASVGDETALTVKGLSNDTLYTFELRAVNEDGETGAAASETVTPTAPTGGICARTDAVRDAIVARIEAAHDCTQVTTAHLAKLRGNLKLKDKGISSLKAGDFASLSKLREIWLNNNQLTSLPSDLFDGLSALEILQLGGNQLDTLQSDVFNRLPALWWLDLSDNLLTRLSAGAFNGLPALEELVLGANQLSTLPVDLFDGLSALWFLDLEEAGLSTLPAEVFDGLPALEELNLEHNQLSDLPADVFDGLSSLTTLVLKENQLSNLPADLFDGLDSLKSLGLDQNRLSNLPTDVFDGLSSLTELTLMANQLTTLPEDVFDGLSSLYWISLPSNRLSTLPDGVFEGLSALGILEVQDNSVDPLVLNVSLERVGNNGFKATVPAGAAFTMTLPVSVENGSIDRGATTLTIPVGAVESGTVTVTRTVGTTAAVTADIGSSLPPPPPRNIGYALAKAPGLPLEVLPELPPALSVADARATEGRDNALVFMVTLDRSASGEVTVSYATSDWTAAAGEDYEAASGTLSFAAGETEKTVEVAVLEDAHDEGEETLAFALSGAAGATIADGEATGTVAPLPGICSRTEEVRDAIVARIEAAHDCTQVTAAHLAKLAGILNLGNKEIGSLKAGDFAGLAKLSEIWLGNNLLTTLPSDLFDGLSALWLLHLHDNQLSTLPTDVFEGLSGLEKLVLGTNQLSTLPVDLFDGLSGLWFLDLEGAGLSTLPTGVFDGLSALEELNLEHNQLSALPADVFDGLSSLTALSLKANQLSSLPEDVFDGLGSLSRLRLDQNQLASLPADVFDGLSSLAQLFLHMNQLASAGLPEDVFDGLSSLYRLQLRSNRLTALPDGLFEGLPGLEFLEVQDNSVDPMVLTASLERVGNNGFKATVPAGAAFTMTLPVSVANGTIDGGATTVRIPAGTVESGTLTVTRTAGTTAAVTADIGPSLPVPPHFHQGYELGKAAGLPREILPEIIPALSVSDASASEGEGVEFTVSLSAASGERVTVQYATSSGTAESGTDFTAASGTVTFGAGETSKTVSVPTADDSLDEEDETFTLTLSNPANATLGDAEAAGAIVDDDEPPPLTASFGDMPETHDGEDSFTFRVAFSEHFPISYKTLRDHAFEVTGGSVRKAERKRRGSNLRWTITVEPDSDGDVTIELPETTDCDATGAICTNDGRPLSHSLSATVDGPAASSVSNPAASSTGDARVEDDGAGRICSAPDVGEEMTPASLAAALWDDGHLNSAQLVALDRMGNGNGRYDLGDMLSWIARCQRGGPCCGGPGPAVGAEPPRTPPAAPASRRPAKVGRRRRRVHGSDQHRPVVPDDRAGGGSVTRWVRAAFLVLGGVTAAWGCGIGDAIVDPQGDAGSAAVVDPGPLEVQWTAPPQARDIGAMLVIEGPAIDSLQAPGLELIETDESTSTRREVVIAGALPHGAALRIWAPDRRDHAQYRVRLLQVAGEDYALQDPAAYGTAISR